jgi:hypothetical protein
MNILEDGNNVPWLILDLTRSEGDLKLRLAIGY